MSKKLGVAVIGLGVGEQHAHAFRALAESEVRWLIDRDAAKAADVRGRVGAGEIAPDISAALADPDVDIVSIASYDDLHYEEVLACFEAGKHVFVEKPLCRTADELAHVRAAWEKAGRPHLMSNLVLRAAEVYRWLGKAIADGEFGRVYAIDGDYLYGRLSKITEGWRKDVGAYSVMEGGGVHLIDLLLTLAGERPASVATVGNRIATEGTSFRYDDFMAATYRFPSGLIGRITANFGCVHRHHHVLRVFGTKQTFIYDDQGPRLHRNSAEDGRAEPLSLKTLPDGKGALIPEFVAAIRQGLDAGPAAAREFDLISAVAASDRAHDTGTEQKIEYES